MARLVRSSLFCPALLLMAAAIAHAGADPWQARIEAGRNSWAFSAPKEPAIPEVRNAGWCKSPIDHFILAWLEARGLPPAPPADKRTLLRRAYFDLIGLPPTPKEVEGFVQDDTPNAFEKVVDGLLARPQYGERWARHWLDVVRYADSFDARGIGSAGDIRYAWRYRDWVVKAFNEDLPYNRFVMEQIAGDQLPGKKPGDFNADGLIATGLYVIGNWPGGDADRQKMMTDIVDDQVDVTGRAFLGVTLACARCHDHKFDPISQKDYYGLAGIFFSSHFLPSPGSPASGVALATTPIASPEQIAKHKEYDQRVASLQSGIETTLDEQYRKLGKSILPRSVEYLSAAAEIDRQGGNVATHLSSVASERRLDPAVLARFADYLAPAIHARPVRKLFTKATVGVAGMAGVDSWTGADGRPDPCVIANNNDHPVSFSTLTIPAKSIAMHPGPSTGVAVGWTSPLTGSVQIRGGVVDGDPNCGDGIDWRIEHVRDNTLETVASGSFPNGGTQEFAQGDGAARLESVDVRAGDVLQLTIFPKENYSCDTTIVNLEIAERDGAHGVWNLSREVVGDLVASNPHPDRAGNPAAWQFFEAGEEKGTASVTPGSHLAQWLAATSAHEDASKLEAEWTDSLQQLDDESDELKKSGKNPDARLYFDLTDPRGPLWATARDSRAALPAEARQTLAKMSQELAELKKNPLPLIEEADALIEGGVPESQFAGIHDCHLMIRGRYDRQQELVPRGFPRLLASADQPKITQGSGRLELARWVASPENPMTAKVMVNRLWQHHFGQGIVRTPNNFGKLGVPPTHPELLDYLARRFVDSGWSIKAMQKMIMLSAAYQQSSVPDDRTLAGDPDNELFGRMNRQRLEAEPFRDALLAISGSLDKTMGGPAFRELNVPRRTLYLMTIRSDRSNFRMLFDAADPTGIVDQRNDSTVAPQALFLMNNPFVLDRAKALADRVMKEGPPDDRARIDWLYRLLYSRPTTDRETEIGMSVIRAGGESWQRYCQVLLCANEFVYVD
jgi:hypothetical protein